MTPPIDPAHAVGTGGAIGAVARHAVAWRVDREDFPLGTLTVNVVGSFLLGLVTFAGVDGTLGLLLGTGVCGSFTTYSSFSFDVVRRWESGEPLGAAAIAAAHFGLAAIAVGAAWLLVVVSGSL